MVSLVFVVLLAGQTGVNIDAPLDCEARDFDVARARLGPRGRIQVESSTVGIRLTAFQGIRRIWSTQVRSRDCTLIGQIADIGVERALRRPSTSGTVGDVPSLAYGSASAGGGPRWSLELGVGALLELAELRGGGMVDLFLRRQDLGARIEFGALAPTRGDVLDVADPIGRLEWFSVHGLLGPEACLSPGWLPETLQPCAGIAGGIEWVRASVSGERLFRTGAGSEVLGRVDGTLRVAWAPGLGGLEAWIRGTWRPDRPTFAVEGAQVDTGLPLWTASAGIRGWLKIF